MIARTVESVHRVTARGRWRIDSAQDRVRVERSDNPGTHSSTTGSRRDVTTVVVEGGCALDVSEWAGATNGVFQSDGRAAERVVLDVDHWEVVFAGLDLAFDHVIGPHRDGIPRVVVAIPMDDIRTGVADSAEYTIEWIGGIKVDTVTADDDLVDAGCPGVGEVAARRDQTRVPPLGAQKAQCAETRCHWGCRDP